MSTGPSTHRADPPHSPPVLSLPLRRPDTAAPPVLMLPPRASRYSRAASSVPCLIARLASSSAATSAPPMRCAVRPAATRVS
jgi:hypothetical protein